MKEQNLNLNDIPKAAKNISKTIKGGEIFALMGTLGAGKTTFVKAIAKQLKIKKHITSPTFVIMNSYPLKLNGSNLHLYHLDLYRTKSFKEVKALGLTEFWGNKNTITFIEWADKIKKHLPRTVKVIKFK